MRISSGLPVAGRGGSSAGFPSDLFQVSQFPSWGVMLELEIWYKCLGLLSALRVGVSAVRFLLG